MIHPENFKKRSQDLEPAYYDAGQFYWMCVKTFLVKNTLWTDNTGCIVLPQMLVQDIDEPEDWEVAEFKYKMIGKS